VPERSVLHRSPRWRSRARIAHANLATTKGRPMRKWNWRNDEGMATVEYAMVTVAAAAFAGVLITLLKSAAVRNLLMGIIKSALGG